MSSEDKKSDAVSDKPRPFTHLSGDCVFQYLDTNLKFYYAANCPRKFRKQYSATPTFMSYLKLTPSDIIINKMEHSFRNIVNVNAGTTRDHAIRNLDGGASYALNTKGHIKRSLELKGADIFISRIEYANSDIQLDIKNRSRQHALLQKFPEEWTKYVAARDQFKRTQPEESRELVTSYVSFSMSSTENNIPHFLRKSQKLTGEHQKTIGDALRHHLMTILGGENRVSNVFHLEIDMNYGILRLPIGSTFRISHLTLWNHSNIILQKIVPVITPDSFPLKSIAVSVKSSEDAVFQNEVLQHAKKLSVYIEESDLQNDWPRVIQNLPINDIHICGVGLSIEDLVLIAKGWIENRREVGTKLSVSTMRAGMHIEAIGEQIGTTRAKIPSRRCFHYPNCATIRINETNELNIYGSPFPMYRDHIVRLNGVPWILVMEVMDFGSAVQVLQT